MPCAQIRMTSQHPSKGSSCQKPLPSDGLSRDLEICRQRPKLSERFLCPGVYSSKKGSQEEDRLAERKICTVGDAACPQTFSVLSMKKSDMSHSDFPFITYGFNG